MTGVQTCALPICGNRAARPKQAPGQGSKSREKRSMTMRHIYWQEKRRVPQMRHSPVVGAGLWGFSVSSTHFPHHCLDFSNRFPADHAGFCAWFLAGVCNDFRGVGVWRRLAALSATCFLGKSRFSPPICRPKRTVYFRLLPNGTPCFCAKKQRKTPDFRRNQVFLVVAEAGFEPTTSGL